jgi:hypothetical protein
MELRYLPLVLAVVACAGGGPTRPKPVVAYAVVVSAGDTQTAHIGDSLPLPIIVTVTEVIAGTSATVPAAGILVDWVVTSGKGSVLVAATVTDGAGQTRQHWTLGDSVGTQTLQARMVNPSTGDEGAYATITATATKPPPPPAPDHLAWTFDNDTLLTVGVAWAWTQHVHATWQDTTGKVDSTAHVGIDACGSKQTPNIGWTGVSVGQNPGNSGYTISGTTLTFSVVTSDSISATHWYSGYFQVLLTDVKDGSVLGCGHGGAVYSIDLHVSRASSAAATATATGANAVERASMNPTMTLILREHNAARRLNRRLG